MDLPDTPPGRSPRKELLGPRPTPLKVHKDSHKIRKPPTAPQQSNQPHNPHAPPRPPVIIYAVSPKIIYTNPDDFMSLVQRLTGPNSNCTSSSTVITSPSTSSYFPENSGGGALSPAARYASIEKTKSPDGRKSQGFYHDMDLMEGVEIGTEIQRTGQFPGILSPNPNALPPIPPNFFSPPSDPNQFNFSYDFSPVLHSSRNFGLENNFFLPSPSIISPQIYMPSPNTVDLFNSLFDP
ncbi:hypothetical protein ACJIZ3_002840 [Penstemon smallii]|uniref:VQ domain-containing protein n=1 Tax=Penstemon smallii TaxID=265156 RepID=A0ABD3UAX4_9LAMI